MPGGSSGSGVRAAAFQGIHRKRRCSRRPLLSIPPLRDESMTPLVLGAESDKLSLFRAGLGFKVKCLNLA